MKKTIHIGNVISFVCLILANLNDFACNNSIEVIS